MHLALVPQYRVYYKNIIHELLTSHFPKLKFSVYSERRELEEIIVDSELSEATHLHHSIFIFYSSTISNYELMFALNYLRFPTVFHFVEGSGRCSFSETQNGNRRMREENNNCQKKWGVNICFSLQH